MSSRNPPIQKTSRSDSHNRKQVGGAREHFAKQKASPNVTSPQVKQNDGYQLLLESEHNKKLIEKMIAQQVESAAITNEGAYRALFETLGVSKEAARDLLQRVDKIRKASLEAEMANQQLIYARHDYERMLNERLGEDGMEQYRAFEARRPALSEAAKLETFASDKGETYDSAITGVIAILIEASQAYTDAPDPHFPLSEPPKIFIGQENVARKLDSDLNALVSSSRTVVQEAREAGISDKYISLVSEYYQSYIDKKEQAIDSVRNPKPVHDE